MLTTKAFKKRKRLITLMLRKQNLSTNFLIFCKTKTSSLIWTPTSLMLTTQSRSMRATKKNRKKARKKPDLKKTALKLQLDPAVSLNEIPHYHACIQFTLIFMQLLFLFFYLTFKYIFFSSSKVKIYYL